MSFWQAKSLGQLTDEEWESLCDGCGQCCLQKLEDEETGQVAVTNVACHYLDLSSCRCSCYPQRLVKVSECIDIRQHGAAAYRWLPPTCAYRLIAGGKDLPAWHPLLTGGFESVHQLGLSVGGYAIHANIPDEMLEDYIIGWID